jgi:DNA-binding transcriptional regulator GbsR (MarR family)
MIEEKRAFKGVWVCAAIWLATDLSWIEKALLAEIDSLVSEASPCYASTERLAARMGVSASRMHHMLSELQNKEYLRKIQGDGRTTYRVVAPVYSSNPKTATRWIKRGIKNQAVVAENSRAALSKIAVQGCQKQQSSLVENDKAELLEIAEQSGQKQQGRTAKNSSPINKEKLRRETQKRIPNDDDKEGQGQEPETQTQRSSSRRIVGVAVSGLDSRSTLGMMESLAQEFGLSSKQRAEVQTYSDLRGKEYVESKVGVVKSQPRRNAAGALLSALRDDWQQAVETGKRERGGSDNLARRKRWEW